MLNNDYREMLQILSEEGVDFIIVGAYALAAHGYPRATGDIDIWVRPDPGNAGKVIESLTRFGSPMHSVTPEDFAVMRWKCTSVPGISQLFFPIFCVTQWQAFAVRFRTLRTPGFTLVVLKEMNAEEQTP